MRPCETKRPLADLRGLDYLRADSLTYFVGVPCLALRFQKIKDPITAVADGAVVFFIILRGSIQYRPHTRLVPKLCVVVPKL